MDTKMFEIRDRGTFIAAIATKLTSHEPDEYYLLRRSGFPVESPMILLSYLEADESHADPYVWYDRGARTMAEAHKYITANFDSLQSGEVIDVEFILGETAVKKQSDKYYGY